MTSEKKQLGLIFTLLAVLVIVPTVCMLWFVLRAAQNEQFAIKQRLIDKYDAEVKQSIFVNLSEYFQNELDQVHKLFKQQNDADNDICYQVLHDKDRSLKHSLIDYVYVFERSGMVIPRGSNLSEESPSIFDKAEQLEFQYDNVLLAAEEYGRIAVQSYEYKPLAVAGKVRCLRKAGKLKDAIEFCKESLSPERQIFEPNTSIYWLMKLLQAEMYAQAGRSELSEAIIVLNNCSFKKLPFSIKAFVFSRVIELIESNQLQEELAIELTIARNELQYSQFLLDIEEQNLKGFSGKLSLSILNDSGSGRKYYAYAGHGSYSNHLIYCIVDCEKLKDYLESKIAGLTDDMIFVNIFDQNDNLIAGEEVKPIDDFLGRQKYHETIFALDTPFYPFKNWRVWCAFRPGVFGFAADNYKMVYIWSAVLVLVSVFVSALIVGRILLSQARINHLKNDFIATVTHELKTPLTSTRMLVETLLEGKYKDQQTVEEYLQIISNENTRLNSLIDNFLTFSRMERSKEVFDKKECEVNELINDAVAMFNKKTDKNLIFSVTKCPESRLILVDKQAMLTAILNLLSNAWKYTEKEPKEIELQVITDTGRICITVKDNGIGLTARQQKKVFDRFFRVDDSLARRAEGTGIGLTIVKFIVEAHGGSIIVKSIPGLGSEFTICLDCEK